MIENLENEKKVRLNESEKLEYKYKRNLEILTENINENEKFEKEMKNKIHEIRSFLCKFSENEENKYDLVCNEMKSFCNSCENDILSINEDMSIVSSEISRVCNNSGDNIIKCINNVKNSLNDINMNLLNLNESINEYVKSIDNCYSDNNEKWFKEDSKEIINSIYKLVYIIIIFIYL